MGLLNTHRLYTQWIDTVTSQVLIVQRSLMKVKRQYLILVVKVKTNSGNNMLKA